MAELCVFFFFVCVCESVCVRACAGVEELVSIGCSLMLT